MHHSTFLSAALLLAGCALACSDKSGPVTPSGVSGQFGSGSAGSAGATASPGGAPVGAGGSSGSGGAALVAGAGGGGSANAGAGGSGGVAGSGGVQGVNAWTRTPFVMDTWFWGDAASATTQVALVEQTGFAGFALSADRNVGEYVSALAAAELPMVGVWTPAALGSYPTGMADSIVGTGGWIWLSINGGAHAVSDPAGDEAALLTIRALADECQSKGLPGVALYPHVGFWLERVSDAVRLAAKAARPDVGVVFNQYHFMAVEGGQQLEATLQSAEPYLKAVTINGSELSASILPLGEGAYDPLPLLRAVAGLDFSGSVGLQGYGITGNIATQLATSKQAWDSLVASVRAP